MSHLTSLQIPTSSHTSCCRKHRNMLTRTLEDLTARDRWHFVRVKTIAFGNWQKRESPILSNSQECVSVVCLGSFGVIAQILHKFNVAIGFAALFCIS